MHIAGYIGGGRIFYFSENSMFVNRDWKNARLVLAKERQQRIIITAVTIIGAVLIAILPK